MLFRSCTSNDSLGDGGTGRTPRYETSGHERSPLYADRRISRKIAGVVGENDQRDRGLPLLGNQNRGVSLLSFSSQTTKHDSASMDYAIFAYELLAFVTKEVLSDSREESIRDLRSALD